MRIISYSEKKIGQLSILTREAIIKAQLFITSYILTNEVTDDDFNNYSILRIQSVVTSFYDQEIFSFK